MAFEIGKLTRLYLGYVGENESRIVDIDVSDWLDQWPDAIIAMTVQRPKENNTYIPVTEVNGGVLSWTVRREDVAIAGNGMAQIRALQPSTGRVYMSRVVPTVIAASMTGEIDDGAVPPESGWVNTVLMAAADAQQSEDDAKDHADRAEAAVADLEQTRSDAIAEVLQTAETETSKATAAIAQKGADTLASIPEDYTSLTANVSQLTEELTDFENEIGYTIPTIMTNGQYVNYVDGQDAANASSASSGYIPVTEGVTYHLANLFIEGGRSVCAYDHNKNFKKFLIWGSEQTELDYTGESGIYYIRATAKGNETVVVTVKDPIKSSRAVRQISKAVYVNGSLGSDDNEGFSTAAAFRTIQKAIDSGAKNIFVIPQNYNESITLIDKHDISIIPYFVASYSSDSLDTPKIHIKGYAGNLLKNAVVMERCSNIMFEHCWFSDCSEHIVMATNCIGLSMTDCIFSDNDASGADNYCGLRLYNTSGRFENCEAYNIDLDGYNIHGYGNTIFINCSAHDCGDDGISHHDGCTGVIDGGEWYRNGKGGVTSPTYSSNIDVKNVYAHDNRYGLYMPNDINVRQMKSMVSNSVFVHNTENDIRIENVDVTAWNVTYGTKRLDGAATFNEFPQPGD